MARNKQKAPPMPPKNIEARITGGRSLLLIAVLLSVVNIAMVLLGVDRQFLFSVAAAYYLVIWGVGVDTLASASAEAVIGPWATGALVVAAVILVGYLLCWYFSKKYSGWMIAGLVLLSLDTLALVVISLMLFGNAGYNVVDLCLHIWILFILGMAVRASVWKDRLELARLIEEMDSGEGSSETVDS